MKYTGTIGKKRVLLGETKYLEMAVWQVCLKDLQFGTTLEGLIFNYFPLQLYLVLQLVLHCKLIISYFKWATTLN